MKLRIGKMTNKELAEWFDIQVKSFTNHKASKLEELKNYAEFYEEKGKVIITKILLDEPYDKKRLNNQNKVINVFDKSWNKNGLDTCKNVSEKILEEFGNEMNLEPKTVYTYTLNARNKLYGKPFLYKGTLGDCQYLWCKREYLDNGEMILIPFTEEEEEIKKKLMKKYFATDEEKDILIREMVETGEITKEEAYDLTCEYRGLNKKGFMAFKKELENILNADVIKGTMLNKMISFEDMKMLGE